MNKALQFKQYKVPAIILALCILGLWAFLGGESAPEEMDHNHSHQTTVDDVNKASRKPALEAQKKADPNIQSTETEINYSFREEVEKVNKLVESLPQTKSKLLNIIAADDIFKARKIEVKPHSIYEDMQNKMGAVKVLALRALMNTPSEDRALRRDLNFIIKRAKDPTIKKIAKAARDSLDKGRSFFDDFVDGVDRMSF